MAFYETVFIARQELTEKQVNELVESFTGIIKKQGGKTLKTEYWGLLSLAYKINKNRKGHYALIESEAPGEAIIELERNMRLNEDVLRYMSVKIKEPSKEASAPLRKDRDDDYQKEAA